MLLILISDKIVNHATKIRNASSHRLISLRMDDIGKILDTISLANKEDKLGTCCRMASSYRGVLCLISH
jgi:hypothetical protein